MPTLLSISPNETLSPQKDNILSLLDEEEVQGFWADHLSPMLGNLIKTR